MFSLKKIFNRNPPPVVDHVQDAIDYVVKAKAEGIVFHPADNRNDLAVYEHDLRTDPLNTRTNIGPLVTINLHCSSCRYLNHVEKLAWINGKKVENINEYTCLHPEVYSIDKIDPMCAPKTCPYVFKYIDIEVQNIRNQK